MALPAHAFHGSRTACLCSAPAPLRVACARPLRRATSRSPRQSLPNRQHPSRDRLHSSSSPAPLQAELYSAGANPLAWEHASPTFTWNREALAPIAAAAPGPWLTPLIHGSIHCEHLSPTTGVSITACLISRRSADHAGTRLKARGVDDAGFVANAVESEQAILFSAANRRATCALVQTRGSAPLFWEQRGSAVKVGARTGARAATGCAPRARPRPRRRSTRSPSCCAQCRSLFPRSAGTSRG